MDDVGSQSSWMDCFAFCCLLVGVAAVIIAAVVMMREAQIFWHPTPQIGYVLIAHPGGGFGALCLPPTFHPVAILVTVTCVWQHLLLQDLSLEPITQPPETHFGWSCCLALFFMCNEDGPLKEGQWQSICGHSHVQVKNEQEHLHGYKIEKTRCCSISLTLNAWSNLRRGSLTSWCHQTWQLLLFVDCTCATRRAIMSTSRWEAQDTAMRAGDCTLREVELNFLCLPRWRRIHLEQKDTSAIAT